MTALLSPVTAYQGEARHYLQARGAHRMSAGRMFVCGDIHGCTADLHTRLDEIGFNKATDKLFALGDLVDRGPDSLGAMALLKEPWFASIQGNHEVLMIEAAKGNDEMHLVNGGLWFKLLDQTERDELAQIASELPVAMTVTTPSGRKVGLVHADFPGNDWEEFMARLDAQPVRDYAQWARERVRRATSGIMPVRGVDHVYFGHTPLKQPLNVANMSWIDTGCFATGRLTVVELL